MYRVFDIALSSDIPLPELEKTDEVSADICFELQPRDDETLHREFDWFHHWYNDDEKLDIACSVARDPDGYRLRYPGFADFLIHSDLRRIRCLPARHAAGDSLRHVLLDHVLPRVLGQSGQLILHASAVQSVDGGAYAFLGQSGWGKSTLAASFCRNGFSLLADDCLKLVMQGGELLGIPSYKGARLKPDSMAQLLPAGIASVPMATHSPKRRIAWPSSRSSDRARMRGMFALVSPRDRQGESVVLKEVRGAAAIMALIKSSFLLDTEDMAAVSRQFGVARSMAPVLPPTFSLHYPHDYGVLGAVMKAVEDSVQRPGDKPRVPAAH